MDARLPVMRWNPVEREWVLGVPGRSGLPARVDLEPAVRGTSACPFCPGSPETPDPYEVLLVASQYPLVHAGSDGDSHTAHGRHTVFLFTDDHRGRLVDQSVGRVTTLLHAIADETNRFLIDDRVQSVFGFQSVGDHFGPTVDHPHGQLIGLPFVPRRMTIDGGDCVACEVRDLVRDHALVTTTESATVVVPSFARLPYEMWVLPNRHVASLGQLRGGEMAGLARALLHAHRSCLNEDGEMPQYLMNIMQGPRGEGAAHHLRIELVPLHRPGGGMKRPGGAELGAGVFINAVPAARAAEDLRWRLRGSDR